MRRGCRWASARTQHIPPSLALSRARLARGPASMPHPVLRHAASHPIDHHRHPPAADGGEGELEDERAGGAAARAAARAASLCVRVARCGELWYGGREAQCRVVGCCGVVGAECFGRVAGLGFETVSVLGRRRRPWLVPPRRRRAGRGWAVWRPGRPAPGRPGAGARRRAAAAGRGGRAAAARWCGRGAGGRRARHLGVGFYAPTLCTHKHRHTPSFS